MDSNYERKLELVKAIREENRSNEARLSHRETIFYGYSKPHQYSSMTSAGTENVPQLNPMINPRAGTGRSLLLRSFAAVVLALFFWTMRSEKTADFLGVTNTQVKNYIREDFSKQVVDYLGNFTYTLDYEKTSAER